MDTKVHFFIRTLTSFDTKYDTIHNADELQKAVESENKNHDENDGRILKSVLSDGHFRRF